MGKKSLFNSTALIFIAFTVGLHGKDAVKPESSYAKIGDLYLKSFDIIEKQEDATTLEKLKKENKEIKLQPKILSEQEKRKITFDNLARQTHHTQPEKSTKLDKEFLNKMELFCSSNENKNAHLLSHINHTHTVFGEATLARILAEPTDDHNELLKRQAIIKELIADEDLFNSLDEKLKKIKEVETHLLAFFQPDHPVNEELFNNLYFGSHLQRFNKNPIALEFYTRLGNISVTSSALALPASILIMNTTKNYFLYKEKNSTFSALIKNSLEDLKLHYTPTGIQKELTQNEELIKKYMGVDFSYPSSVKWITGAGKGWELFNYINGMRQSYINARLNKDIANHLQTKLIGVASYINNIKQMHVVLSNSPLNEQFHALNNIEHSLINPSEHSKSFKKLINLLNNNTFTEKASFFSLTGRVLAAYQLMHEVKDEFIGALETAGEIDAYLSTAKLYKEHASKRVRYTFVEFAESDTPFIKATNFWNPFIDTDIVVPNSLEQGDNQQNNIILTGPNTGGKSTILKGIGINILLAQTFGIAPAEQLILTPFANINCYLNITDNIAAGVSLFKAEVLRAKELIDSIRSLKKNAFSFTIMDEIFSGTSPKEAEEGAYEFSSKLGEFNNSLCLVATHFPKLTALENSSSYKNYRVAVRYNEDGALVLPFKLEEGINTVNIAIDLLKEENVL